MIYDLLYLESSAETFRAMEYINKVSALKVGIASDQIHPHRISIETEMSLEDYLVFLFKTGLRQVSLTAKLAPHENPEEHHQALIRAVAEIQSDQNSNNAEMAVNRNQNDIPKG